MKFLPGSSLLLRRFPRLRAKNHVRLPFIFVIGFNKTATRAFHHFFSQNGFPSVHWDEGKLAQKMAENVHSGRRVFDGYDQEFRVFSDLFSRDAGQIIEGNSFYREMNSDYPGAFFVLNNRNTEAWIQSRERHRSGALLAQQLAILQSDNPEDARDLWRSQKNVFEREVRKYFDGNARFLELDIDRDNVPLLLEQLIGFRLDPAHWMVIGKTQ